MLGTKPGASCMLASFLPTEPSSANMLLFKILKNYVNVFFLHVCLCIAYMHYLQKPKHWMP